MVNVLGQVKVGPDAVEFVRNRVQLQDEHMAEIWQIFGYRVRGVLPLFETEVRGAKMLTRLTEHPFASLNVPIFTSVDAIEYQD